MKCPKCEGEVKSICGQVDTPNNETYRCKKCVDCGYTFYTVEFEVEVTPQFKKEWKQYSSKWYKPN